MKAYVSNGPGEPFERRKDWQFQLLAAAQQNVHKLAEASLQAI